MVSLTYEELLARAGVRVPHSGKAYGVPNGGLFAALLACQVRPAIRLVEAPEEADFFIDDVVDSGVTRERFAGYGKPFIALVDKTDGDSAWAGTWVSFPWERARQDSGPEDAIRRLLQYLGEDSSREGLRETPARVVRSYGELFAGYRQDPGSVLKCFTDGACDEMVILKNIEVASVCEHHMLPFMGEAHVAYLPRGRVVGVSKLARLVEVFARRLQIQERMTTQVTAALDEHLKPYGSACVVEARHLCMACRGVQKQHSVMVTSSLTGEFRKPEVRAEFFNLVRGGR